MSAALDALRSGGKPALARLLARIESAPGAEDLVALLDEALLAPKGLTLGVTGPPGVGKSTLLDALVAQFRARDLTVGLIAVDPSSVRSGGALLGDRARLSSVIPGDPGVFMRSMASRGHLGGLCDLVFPALAAMQAIFDFTIVETVGVGQSETEVSGLTDAALLCIQPASGDSLQFLKAGIMEIPDLAIVTKSDIGATARRAAADLRLALAATGDGQSLPVFLVSSTTGDGMHPLVDDLLRRRVENLKDSNLVNRRKQQAALWTAAALRIRYGLVGERVLLGDSPVRPIGAPFARLASVTQDFDKWVETMKERRLAET